MSMGFTMSKSSYQKLVDEDIKWLDNIMAEHDPYSLEGKHIRSIVEHSPEYLYKLGYLQSVSDMAKESYAGDDKLNLREAYRKGATDIIDKIDMAFHRAATESTEDDVEARFGRMVETIIEQLKGNEEG